MSRLHGPSAAICRERNFTPLPAGFMNWPKPRNLDTRSQPDCFYRTFATEPAVSGNDRCWRKSSGLGGRPAEMEPLLEGVLAVGGQRDAGSVVRAGKSGSDSGLKR